MTSTSITSTRQKPSTPRRGRMMTRLVMAALAALMTLAIAGTASAATASWDSYNIATQAPIVAGGGVKAFAHDLYGPNPLHSDRSLNFRVARNIGGVITYSTETTVPAGPGSAFRPPHPGSERAASRSGSRATRTP